MPPTLNAATMPQDLPPMADGVEGTVITGAIGAGALWLIQRVLNSPDKTNDLVNALEKRVIKLETRLGSEGDVGTILHTLTAMQEQMHEMAKLLRDLTNKRGTA